MKTKCKIRRHEDIRTNIQDLSYVWSKQKLSLTLQTFILIYQQVDDTFKIEI